MKWPFVRRSTLRNVQQYSHQLLDQLEAARVEMRLIEGESGPLVNEFERETWTIAHRIRVHREELRFQPMADEKGIQYNWVCTGGTRLEFFINPAGGGVPEPPTFHQHHVKPRVQRQEKV